MANAVDQTENISALCPNTEAFHIEPFDQTLFQHNLTLNRGETTTLQINVGLLCNLFCKHCHLEAGPLRDQLMDAETMDQVIDYAARSSFETIDITGGAPELNPRIENLIRKIAPLTSRLLVRTNLIALEGPAWERYMSLCKENRVVIIASLPSLNETQTDAQRGEGAFQRIVASLKKLNAIGYGIAGSGLELNLASNPVGAYMNTSQMQAEKRFHEILLKKWGINFTTLYNFSNVPLGRFRRWLQSTGQLDNYLIKLAGLFNPCSISSIMCRSSVSINWQGYLFDCDFNIASEQYLGGIKIHVSQMAGLPACGLPIMVGEHCYACTAGAGFTCGGTITV
jgi:radical SAM/Cys-rich protein